MEINVGGEKQDAIETYLKRVKNGIMVSVTVSPEVEEFFQQWGTGRKVTAASIGRSWLPYQKSKDTPAGDLEVWEMGPIRDGAHDTFDIYGVGRSLGANGERGQNISFIRLVGASKGASFLYEDVVSWDGLNAMAERIRVGTQRFYDQYIRPAHLQITVSTDVKRLE